ncbi:MAG TPA: hypothetical protein DCM07_28910 [Planctomycetaceae bacterium]|nr:hypothetical protein [Gimesia sp.]HAH48789.1 hypothetical protein [Planctomycetaceae bacterium]
MAGLSGRVEWMWKAWFQNGCGSCDLLLAALGPNCIRAYPFCFWLVLGFSWSKNVMGMFHSVAIMCDAVSNLARRAETFLI